MLASLVLQLMFISSVNSADVKCMTKNVYFEANNQSELGKEAIVHVVLNRVEDPKFPDTPCKVIHQAKRDRNGNPIRNKCQFSWYCDGKSDKINDPIGYDLARQAVIKALLRRAYTDHDPTLGSKFYHATYVKPYWAKSFRIMVDIGDHIFYNKQIANEKAE